MSDSTRRLLAWLPMVGVFALVVRVALVWNQLPTVMMSHFDLEGNPNGWMPRATIFVASFALMFFMVGLFAMMADRMGRRKPSAGWALLLISWVTAAVLTVVFWAAVTANLNRQPLHMFPIWIPLVLLVPVVIALSIDWRWWLSRRRREAARQVASAQSVAEHTHGSHLWGGFFAVLGLGLLGIGFVLPEHQSGFAFPLLITIGALIALSAIWAWRGFVYRFTTQGVEIRALGLRLRSIPLSEIKDFRSERCNPLTDFGGWGVKGFGTDTAYIWGGHKALHIRTYSGDVYLGFNDPDRLVRDLEAIMNPAHS